MPVCPACCIWAVLRIYLICSVIVQAVTAADSISDSGTDSESINIDQDSTGVDESLNEALRELDELVSLNLCLISISMLHRQVAIDVNIRIRYSHLLCS